MCNIITVLFFQSIIMMMALLWYAMCKRKHQFSFFVFLLIKKVLSVAIQIVPWWCSWREEKKVKSLSTQKRNHCRTKKNVSLMAERKRKGCLVIAIKRDFHSFHYILFEEWESEKEKIIMVHNRCLTTTTTNTPSWSCDDIWEADKKRMRYYFFI